MSDVKFTAKDYIGRREDEEYPTKALTYVRYLAIPTSKIVAESKIIVYGSSRTRLQPYYSDIDSFNIVDFNENVPVKEVGRIFRIEILKLINRLPADIIFTDFKAGNYEDGQNVHWTLAEIEAGHRIPNLPDFNGHKGAKDFEKAVYESLDKSLLKLDLVAKYYGRYIELSMVYGLTIGKKPVININISERFGDVKEIISSLAKDATKQVEKGKIFKSLKRIYSMARLEKDIDLLKMLTPLIIGNTAKISVISADLSTIDLLLKLNAKLDVDFVLDELEIMKDKISSVLDVDDFNPGEFVEYLYDLTKEFKKQPYKPKRIMDIIEEANKYIVHATSATTINYLNLRGYNSPNDLIERERTRALKIPKVKKEFDDIQGIDTTD